MAFLGTLIGAVLAVPLALLCASTTFPIRFMQFGFRRFADGLRTFDHLIWALVFVRAIGLGPLAGIVAIALVDLGTLAKLYSEAIDNASPQPVEGVRASGGSWLDGIRLGILPQILPMRRRIGMIFQEFALIERLTVMENVLSGRLGYTGFWRSWFRRFAQVDIERAIALLDRVGLAEHIDKRADALSAGRHCPRTDAGAGSVADR
jgi:phosphonate transport system permease protein